MTSYSYTTVTNYQTIAFNPQQDSFNFDNSTISAAPGFVIQQGANLLFNYGGKTFTFTGVSLAQLSSTNVTFANGSQLLVGDKISTTTNDSAGNLLNGGDHDDLLYGLDGNDTLIGGLGNNVLNGGAGNDVLYSSIGNDILIGGSGIDVVDYSAANVGVKVDLNILSAQYTVGAGFDTLTEIENLTGSNYDDTLTGNSVSNLLSGGAGNDVLMGNAGNDTLDGGTGNDTLVGGTGNDSYIVDNTGDVVTETSTLATEIDTVQSSISWTLGDNLENLTLMGNLAINGTGNSLANIITGNAADNILDGGVGNDTLIGGMGNDTYIVDNTGDVITETSTLATEMDTVQSSISWTLGDNLENLTLVGNDKISGTGNALANTIIGNAAANTLDGGMGNDTLEGGWGKDSYRVDSTGDVIREDVNLGETDTVRSSVSWTLGDNLEKLILVGAAKNGMGNDLNNTITGNSLNNVLDGGMGNDTLDGGVGNDTLTGGAGADVFNFTTANGFDRITDFSVADDTIQLKSSAFTSLDTIGLLSSDAFKAGADMVAADDANTYLIYNSSTGDLYYDADGNAGAAAVKIAILGANLELTYADFVVI